MDSTRTRGGCLERAAACAVEWRTRGETEGEGGTQKRTEDAHILLFYITHMLELKSWCKLMVELCVRRCAVVMGVTCYSRVTHPAVNPVHFVCVCVCVCSVCRVCQRKKKSFNTDMLRPAWDLDSVRLIHLISGNNSIVPLLLKGFIRCLYRGRISVMNCIMLKVCNAFRRQYWTITAFNVVPIWTHYTLWSSLWILYRIEWKYKPNRIKLNVWSLTCNLA